MFAAWTLNNVLLHTLSSGFPGTSGSLALFFCICQRWGHCMSERCLSSCYGLKCISPNSCTEAPAPGISVCASPAVITKSLWPMNYSPPDSSVRWILQARTLEWLPFPSPGNLPDPGIEPGSPAWQADSLPSEPPRKPWYLRMGLYLEIGFILKMWKS